MLSTQEERRKTLILGLYNQANPGRNLTLEDIGISNHRVRQGQVRNTINNSAVTTTFFGFRKRTGVPYSNHRSYRENLALIRG